MDYRGARFYDGDVGRFLSLDPLAEIYPSNSYYFYVAGNPISIIDPDGREWSEANKELADLYGVFGNGGEKYNDIKNLFTKEKDLTFKQLWNNYPKWGFGLFGDIEHIDPKTGKDLYASHCAINCSESLYKSGVELNKFKGVKCNGSTCPAGESIHALRAQELADWIKTTSISGLGPATFLTGSTFEEYVQGKKGIIFFQDYWQRSGEKGNTRTGDHIDLWNKNELGSIGWTRTYLRRQFPEKAENSWNMSDLRKSKQVIFWEVQ